LSSSNNRVESSDEVKTLGKLLLVPLLAALCAGIVLGLGLIDFSASTPPGAIEERVATFALNRSIARHSPRGRNPFAGSPEDARAGLLLLRSECVTCHGAPGADPSAAGASLNPPAPGLTLPRVQARRDGELYWIVSRGIRMTGMPAFGPSRGDREIWQLVAALRRLPRLTETERRALHTGQ
jgi:mono/diheme cytochrome c family protein